MLKPINDYVLVKVLKRETTTVGGIILPDSLSESRFVKGAIEGMGDKVKYVQIGNLVAYVQFKADVLLIKGVKYHLIKEKDISLILDDDVRIEEVM